MSRYAYFDAFVQDGVFQLEKFGPTRMKLFSKSIHQKLATRIFPLCKSFMLLSQFVESRSQFKKGLFNHAFAAALGGHLLDYRAMIAQHEHQFRLQRLSIHGLWFYKALYTPMLGSLQALSFVVRKVVADDLMGSSVLNLLQSQTKAMAGDSALRSLLEKVALSASSAYLSILERRVYEGVIDDPYGEFFIAENKTIQVPVSEESKLVRFGANHHYLECIKKAYDFYSGELLDLVKAKYDLMGKLRSIKHYLLLDQGDFLVHFMDIADEELLKISDDISVEKLQSLLDIALCSTAAAADPCNEDLSCYLERSSLLNKLAARKDPTTKKTETDNTVEAATLTGLETFSLSYKVMWPLSIVISRKALTKYQLIFRFLHCKHVSSFAGLGKFINLQGIRALNMRGTAVPRSSLLCRSMLKFVNSLLHYRTFEVLEPNWHIMHIRQQTVKSIDEVINYHDFFLQKCLKECWLLSPVLLKKVERLMLICLQYAAATQWLILSSVEIPKPEAMAETDPALGKFIQGKSRTPPQAHKIDTGSSTVTESILKCEREFNSEFHSLGPILSSSSQFASRTVSDTSCSVDSWSW